MRTFGRFSRKRKAALSKRMAAMGRRSQEVQRERRLAEMTPEVLREMETNPAIREGSPLRSIRVYDFITGEVIVWVVERGDRTNNYRLRTPDGRKSKPHGMAWIFEKLRPYLIGRKTRPLS